MRDWWHRLRWGHDPEWVAVDYDFLTWRYACLRCHPTLRGWPDGQYTP